MEGSSKTQDKPPPYSIRVPNPEEEEEELFFLGKDEEYYYSQTKKKWLAFCGNSLARMIDEQINKDGIEDRIYSKDKLTLLPDMYVDLNVITSKEETNDYYRINGSDFWTLYGKIQDNMTDKIRLDPDIYYFLS